MAHAGHTAIAASGLDPASLLADAFGGVEQTSRTLFEHALQALNDVLARVFPNADFSGLSDEQAGYARTAARLLVVMMLRHTARRMWQPASERDAIEPVPQGLVRSAVAAAAGVNVQPDTDGWTAITPTGPLPGLATGPVTVRQVRAAGGALSGYRWVYGPARRSISFGPHRALDGLVFIDFTDPRLANTGDWPAHRWFIPGDHVNCFPGETIVSGPVPHGATLRDYDGEIIVISAASGEDLTVTPNHPILTDRGWVPAGQLVRGDNLVRCVDTERATGLIPDAHQGPARIDDVAAALNVAPGVVSRRVPVAPEDFHGDGTGSDVAVVWADGGLMPDGPVNAESLGQSLDGLTGCVQPAEVIEVNRHAFHGPVYNLHTTPHWYVANGYIVHNCRCDIEPIIITR